MANVAQRSFSAGEISPAMYARSDMERYATALRTLRNAVVLRTGGVQSRPGTEYLGSTKANGEARLVSAVFDTTANYVLEFGDEYVRFWKNGALITIATQSAWVTATAYTVGTLRSNGGTNYLCLIAHTSGTFATDLAAGKWYALTGAIYEWPTPYLAAELFDLQFAFQLDVVTIVHPLHPPATLTRLLDADWRLADIDFNLQTNAPTNVAVSGTAGTDWGYTVTAVFADGSESGAGAYVRTNLSSGGVPFAIYTALAAAPRTVTWTAVTGAVSYKVYANEGNFSLTELRGTGTGTSFVDNGGFAISYGDPPVASGDFVGTGDYPAVVAAYQQRLLLAGTVNQPDVVQASRVALPYDFSVSSPLVDSDSLEWRQVGRRLNRVRHFVEAAQRLFQFSDVGESIVQGDTDGILRPGEVNPRQFSENGAAVRPAPLVVNDTALYVQARGSMVRDLAPIQVGGFAGSDLTLQAAHLVDGYELVDWCYQQTPHSVVWAVRDDGQLLSLTYVRELGILGWAHHDTLGEIESVCCVPEATLDAVYVVVKRTIDGNVVRYVERLSNRLGDTVAIADSHVVATAYDTPQAGTIYIEEYAALQHTATLSDDVFQESEVGNLFAVEDPSTGDKIRFTLDSVTGATTSPLQHTSYDMAWAEYLGLFIAVDGQTISTSPDGVNWTLRYTSATSGLNWTRIAVSESLGRVVVVSQVSFSSGKTAYSDDCITWTEVTPPISKLWYGVCWGESAGRFVAVGGNAAIYSTDGISWTSATMPAGFAWRSVAYSETAGLFVSVSQSSGSATGRATTSPTGATWTGRTTPNLSTSWQSIDVNQATGRIVACGAWTGGGGGSGQEVMTSDDGIVWTAQSTSASNDFRDVVYSTAFGGWIAVGANEAITSYDDGATWTALPALLPDPIALFSITVSDSLGLFVAGNALSATPRAFTSIDGNLFIRNDASQSAIISFTEAPPASVLYDNVAPWFRGFTAITGLSHIEGENVSVSGDGVIVASPNNAEYATVTVSGGEITLGSPVLVAVVGLPYTTDIQTLDIDAASTTVKERGLNIGGVIAWIEETGSFYAGPVVPSGDTLTGLEKYTPQNSEGYDVAGPVTGVAEVTLQSTYNNSGRVLIRQVDPVPMTILSIAPTGFLNGGR